MRIVVIMSRNGQEQDRRTQYIAESAVAGIVTGETDRSRMADVDMLLAPFADLDDTIVSSLKARLRVFVVPTSYHVAIGYECRGEARHAIVDGGIPRSIPTGDDAPEGAVVATFRLDDVTTVRHEIDPTVVAETIERAIEKKTEFGRTIQAASAKRREAYEATIAKGGTWKGHVPETVAEEEAFLEERIAEEREVYAKVRIIEMVGQACEKNRFFLVYGEQPDDLTGHRTGGFISLDKAREWFTGQGR